MIFLSFIKYLLIYISTPLRLKYLLLPKSNIYSFQSQISTPLRVKYLLLQISTHSKLKYLLTGMWWSARVGIGLHLNYEHRQHCTIFHFLCHFKFARSANVHLWKGVQQILHLRKITTQTKTIAKLPQFISLPNRSCTATSLDLWNTTLRTIKVIF